MPFSPLPVMTLLSALATPLFAADPPGAAGPLPQQAPPEPQPRAAAQPSDSASIPPPLQRRFAQAQQRLAAAVSAGTVPETVAPEPWVRALRKRMQVHLNVAFRKENLAAALSALSHAGNLNIVLDPSCHDRDRSVTYVAQDVTLGDALRGIMSTMGLSMTILDQAIFISSVQDTPAILIKMYDISDLVSPIPGVTDPDHTAFTPQQLCRYIRTTVDPASWGRVGIAIDSRAQSTLFVTQTEPMHDRIALLLSFLRQR